MRLKTKSLFLTKLLLGIFRLFWSIRWSVVSFLSAVWSGTIGKQSSRSTFTDVLWCQLSMHRSKDSCLPPITLGGCGAGFGCAGNQISSKLMSVTPMLGKKQRNPLAARVLILHLSHLCRRSACWSFNVCVFCVLCLRHFWGYSILYQLCCVLCALWNGVDKLALLEEDYCLILAMPNNLLALPNKWRTQLVKQMRKFSQQLALTNITPCSHFACLAKTNPRILKTILTGSFCVSFSCPTLVYSACASMCILVWMISGHHFISFISRFYISSDGMGGFLIHFWRNVFNLPTPFHSRPVLCLRPRAGNQISSKLMSVTPMLGKKQRNPLAARVLILHLSHLCRRSACWSFNVCVFCVLCLRHFWGYSILYQLCCVLCALWNGVDNSRLFPCKNLWK